MDTLLNIVVGNLKGKSSVLEVGCGEGVLINAIAKKLPMLQKIAAIDCCGRPQHLHDRVEFAQQDVEMQSVSGSYDLIVLNQVFEHMRNPLGVLTDLRTHLNRFGRILIVVPNRRGFNNEARVYMPEHGKHYFLWDKESLEYSLNRIGLTCRFYNLYTAASHNLLLKYIPTLLRLQNPNLTCVAMPDDAR